MQTAVVRFDASGVLHRLAPGLHGHRIEDVGRCLRDGLCGRTAAGAPWRRDVVRALAALDIPVLPWRASSLTTRETPDGPALGQYIDLCRSLGAEPYVMLPATYDCTDPAGWLRQSGRGFPETSAAAEGTMPPVRFCEIGPSSAADPAARLSEQSLREGLERAAALRAGVPGMRVVLPCGERVDQACDALRRAGPRAAAIDALAVQCHSGQGLSDSDGSPAKLLRLWRDLQAKERFLREAIDRLDVLGAPDETPGLVLRHWGAWYGEARATNGLAMANTLADALFAAASLHLFHALGPRLRMAHLAYAVNALQALVLTRGDRLAKTATYQAFALLRPHQGARRTAFEISAPPLDLGGTTIGRLSASLSRADEDRLFISLVNLSPTDPLAVDIVDRTGARVRLTPARVLRAQSLASENFPGRPNQVALRALESDAGASPIHMRPSSAIAGYLSPDRTNA